MDAHVFQALTACCSPPPPERSSDPELWRASGASDALVEFSMDLFQAKPKLFTPVYLFP